MFKWNREVTAIRLRESDLSGTVRHALDERRNEVFMTKQDWP